MNSLQIWIQAPQKAQLKPRIAVNIAVNLDK